MVASKEIYHQGTKGTKKKRRKKESLRRALDHDLLGGICALVVNSRQARIS
jgi:hypothetical protein